MFLTFIGSSEIFWKVKLLISDRPLLNTNKQGEKYKKQYNYYKQKLNQKVFKVLASSYEL